MRITSIAGLGFVIAVIAAIVVTGAVPGASQPATEISQYFVDHRLEFLIAAWLVALFSAFATGVCDYLLAIDVRESTALRWAWAGALLSSAALLIASAIQAALAYHAVPISVIPLPCSMGSSLSVPPMQGPRSGWWLRSVCLVSSRGVSGFSE